MVDRRYVGSWLQGPGASRSGGPDAGRYAGERLGCPPDGPGSVAGFGQRLVAFLCDSVLCAAIAWGLPREPAYTTPIFALEVLVLTAFTGASAGQRLRGLQVARLDGKPVGLLRSAIRTALLLLLVPVLITDGDGRGLHDRAAGTVVLRRR